jgi:excisionase family DNA binding protein
MHPPSPDDRLPIAKLLREFRDKADALLIDRQALESVTYRTVYRRILDGQLPAEKMGRDWSVRRADFPAVILVLGLGGQRRKPGRPRKDVSSSSAAAAA